MKWFKDELKAHGGLWEYNGHGKYLAQLSSGKISSLFLNTGVITTRPVLLETWASSLTKLFYEHLYNKRISVSAFKTVTFIGPGMGGITLAYELARQLSNFAGIGIWRNLTSIYSFFTEPAVNKGQAFRFSIPEESLIILTEDVITTGESVQKTLNVVCETEQRVVLPVVLCLVDRRENDGELCLGCPTLPGGYVKTDVVCLSQIQGKTWNTIAEAQKDCKNVTEALRPKANWEKLTCEK